MSIYTIQVLVLGACVGSFLNVIIFRLPKNKSIVLPRSQCSNCKTKLRFFDLVPILSWLFLKGKCRYCKKSISFRYPLVEALTSISFLLCFEINNYFFSSIFLGVVSGWLLSSFLITLAFIDVDQMILPNSLTFSGSFLALIIFLFDFLFNNNSITNILIEHSLAYIFAFFGLYLFSIIVKLILNKPGLGGGDIKLFAMSGAWLGITGLEVTIVFSFIIAGFFSILGILFRRISRGDYIPFGPFICFSFFLVWVFGDEPLIHLFQSLFWWKYI